jgi:hypothetical protein
MDLLKRRSILALAALPGACALQTLAPLNTTRLDAQTRLAPLRAAALGQQWTYKKLNFFNSQILDVVTERVESLAGGVTIKRQAQTAGALADEIHSSWGQVKQDPYWDLTQIYEMPMPLWSEDWTVGHRQSFSSSYQLDQAAQRRWIKAEIKVAAWEQVRLASHQFNTLRVEKVIYLEHADTTRLSTRRTDTLWLAPEIGRWVARETSGSFQLMTRRGGLRSEDIFRWELESWT